MTGNVSNFRLEATFKEHMAIVEPCLKGDWEKAKEQLITTLNNQSFRVPSCTVRDKQSRTPYDSLNTQNHKIRIWYLLRGQIRIFSVLSKFAVMTTALLSVCHVNRLKFL